MTTLRSTPRHYLPTLLPARATSYETFAEGWLMSNGQAWGRPVYIKELSDGSLLVSDDLAGAIYRIGFDADR